MNHEMRSTITNKQTVPIVVAIAALAAVLVAGAAAVGSGHMALANSGNKTKENDGISIPTKTHQKQECQTAGATSPITASCTAVSTNTVNQSGGVLSEEK
jgi:flagellar basal body-associated protein FliL